MLLKNERPALRRGSKEGKTITYREPAIAMRPTSRKSGGSQIARRLLRLDLRVDIRSWTRWQRPRPSQSANRIVHPPGTLPRFFAPTSTRSSVCAAHGRTAAALQTRLVLATVAGTIDHGRLRLRPGPDQRRAFHCRRAAGSLAVEQLQGPSRVSHHHVRRTAYAKPFPERSAWTRSYRPSVDWRVDGCHFNRGGDPSPSTSSTFR